MATDARATVFAREAAERWDSDAIRADVIRTQRARILVQDALVTGQIHPWDFEPRFDASKIYNRNYGAELYAPTAVPACRSSPNHPSARPGGTGAAM